MNAVEIHKHRYRLLYVSNINPDETTKWGTRYAIAKDTAADIGVGFDLSFAEYVCLAVAAGIRSISQMGRGRDQFILKRIDETGDYTPGNCRFTLPTFSVDGKIEMGLRAATTKNKTIRAKRFVIKSPGGTVYRGKNLSEFCKKHGLNKGAMYAVCSGNKLHHMLWRGHYLPN